MPKQLLTEVECNHCGKPIPYNENYLVATWMYMSLQDLECHEEREAEFCKKCATLIILAIRRHVKRA